MSENLVSCMLYSEHRVSICSETLAGAFEIVFCHNAEDHMVCPSLQTTNTNVPSLCEINALCTRTIFKTALFWVVTPCGLVGVYRCFRGRFRLHLQDRMVREASKSPYLYLAGFLLGLLVGPEHGNDTLLRNICERLPNYTASHPRR
jgi:hypothetical protein